MEGSLYDQLEHMASLAGWSEQDKCRILCSYIESCGHKDHVLTMIELLIQTGWPHPTKGVADEQTSDDPKKV